MPQLDLFSYTSVVFWLLIFIALFYFIGIRFALPNLYKILILRSVKLTTSVLLVTNLTNQVLLLNSLYLNLIEDTFSSFKDLFKVLKTDTLSHVNSAFSLLGFSEVSLFFRFVFLFKVENSSLLRSSSSLLKKI